MERYYKSIDSGYLTAIGTGAGGEEITQEEYEKILSIVLNCPTAEAGYQYKLRTDLTWELVELPTEDDPDLSDTEAMEIILGVSE